MEPTIPLPTRLFLLAYDPKKNRLTNWTQLGTLLRAGALGELALTGRVADENGRVVLVGQSGHGTRSHPDPVLDALLSEIAASSKPRKWEHWIGRRNSQCLKLVRAELDAQHLIKAERRRLLGVVPYWQVTLRDTRTRSRLAESARRVLHGGEPVERIDRRDAAVVALAAHGGLRIVVSGPDKRKYKRRIEALADHVGPVVRGLRKAVQNAQAAAAAG